jgi:hypothetical protein
MINVKADDLERRDKFVYVEAVRSGAYVRNRFGLRSKTLNVRVFFCRFNGFALDTRETPRASGRVSSDGVKNEQVLTLIEDEIVCPFIRLLDTPEAMKALTGGQPWQRLAFQYPPSRFDGNELSVMLDFTVTSPYC